MKKLFLFVIFLVTCHNEVKKEKIAEHPLQPFPSKPWRMNPIKNL